jgi:hypothetical protein
MQADCAAAQLHQMRVTFERGNLVDRPTLEKLVAAGYQYIVILSPTDAPEIQLADASTIVTLLHLRDLAGKTGRSFSIISEILDVRVEIWPSHQRRRCDHQREAGRPGDDPDRREQGTSCLSSSTF